MSATTEGRPRTLAQLFDRASTELFQDFGTSFGYRSKKTACALGAIEYYWGDLSSEYLQPSMEQFRDATILALREGIGSIGRRNYEGWTFAKFRDKCLELGL